MTSLLIPRELTILANADAENKLNNPDGIKFDIGYDFVEATMAGMLDHAAVSSGAARSRKGLWR